MLSCWRRGRWQPAAAAAAGPAPAASTAREAACKRLQGAQISPGWPARRPRAPERGAVQWWAGTPAPAPYLSMHAFPSVPGVHCYSTATLQALPRAAWAATGASRPPPSVCRSFAALHRLNAVIKQSTTLLPLPAKRYAHSHAAGSAGPGRLPGGPAHRGSGRGGAPAAAGGWGGLPTSTAAAAAAGCPPDCVLWVGRAVYGALSCQACLINPIPLPRRDAAGGPCELLGQRGQLGSRRLHLHNPAGVLRVMCDRFGPRAQRQRALLGACNILLGQGRISCMPHTPIWCVQRYSLSCSPH